MALTDPQSVTISGTPSTLPRTDVGEDRSEYTSADGLITMTFSHQYDTGKGKRTRRQARIDVRKIAPDWAKPAENVEVTMSYYIVVDLPKAGFTNVEAKAVVDGFNTTLQASSGALITKLLGGES